MSLMNLREKLDTVSCPMDATATEIAQIMKTEGVGCVLIHEDGTPVGIVTDRDLVLRCIAEGEDPDVLIAQEFMTSPVHKVSAYGSILDLVEKMDEYRVRRICVADADGEPVGIISAGDVFELLVHEMSKLAQASGPRRGKLFDRTATDAA